MAEESLDEILSSPTPAAEATTGTTPEQTTASPEAVRDEHGRFAPRTPAQPETTDQPATGAEPTETPSGTVPQQALHETRQQLKAEREAREALERRIAAFEASQRQPATPPAPPPKAPDFWEDPNKFVEFALTPVQQQMAQQKLDMSRMLASDKHGEDVVTAADKALGEAVKANPALMPEAQRILASRHPYDEVVKWHKQTQAQARIGSDPDAFVQAELDRMLADPAKKAELLARLTGSASAAPGAPQSNVTRLPPSLSRLPGGNAEPSAGEESLDSILKSGRARR